MEVIVITFLLIIFPRDAFVLAFKYIYIYGKTSYFCCALKFRAASPRQRCPSHKGSPPHIQPCFQQIFHSRRVFSSKFHVLVVVFCWMLSSEPSGGGISAAPIPVPTCGCSGTCGVPLPTARCFALRPPSSSSALPPFCSV